MIGDDLVKKTSPKLTLQFDLKLKNASSWHIHFEIFILIEPQFIFSYFFTLVNSGFHVSPELEPIRCFKTLFMLRDYFQLNDYF